MAEKSLAERIERLEAVYEIQNLMGRYSYYHTADMQEATVELWAKGLPDLKVDLPWGVYEGPDAAERCYLVDHQRLPEEARAGALHMHTMTTPVIEIAGDGKTAKGVWISPGAESMVIGDKANANWAWLKYAADFVKQDGKWKFWHLQHVGVFYTPYDQSWAEVEPIDWSAGGAPDEELPAMFEGLKEHAVDRPRTKHYEYTPTLKQELVPVPPEPYETFDPKTAYGL